VARRLFREPKRRNQRRFIPILRGSDASDSAIDSGRLEILITFGECAGRKVSQYMQDQPPNGEALDDLALSYN
jgi:hypothetical protein